jgi:hypothetical protein
MTRGARAELSSRGAGNCSGASWPTPILAGHLPRHRRAVSAHEARLAVAFLDVQLRTPLYFAITNASRKFIAAIMLLAGRQVCPR